ncbi:MAG: SAM-dependent methyltransferase [Herminiimonas sp.]|nr:SAM-dependent methyltransferase [Herminiimonas sp.]
MPTFQTGDPSAPAFWTERFERNFMPWDRGGVPAALEQFVAAAPGPMVALIPGCGIGYEVAYLSEAGWDVTAIDFSPAAVAAAQAALGPWAGRVLEADFFTFVPQKPIEMIYERAFLCALPRRKWERVVQRWAELLPVDGLLAGFFFFDAALKGPPFGADRDELQALLRPYFVLTDNQAVNDSIAVFKGRERWQVWRRI